jgi:hypothetical protein
MDKVLKLLTKQERKTLIDAEEIMRFIYYGDKGDALSITLTGKKDRLGQTLTVLQQLNNYKVVKR